MNVLANKHKFQDLADSRLKLHYAIQFIAATGAGLLEPQPDASHVSLKWNPALKIFAGQVIPVEQPFQVALEPVSLTSLILSDRQEQIASFPLAQKTMAEALAWHQQEISKLGADGSKLKFLSYPPDFPDSTLARGATFDISNEAGRQELAQYYNLTDLLLEDIVAKTAGASPIRIWPHHFDIATLISLPGVKNSESLSIGVGLSPGDGSYNEPYWYVSPYPYPPTANLPQLDADGCWHTEDWVGGVLTASLLNDDAEEQRSRQVKDFLDSAVKASQILLRSS
jgi:hypothetical protein